MYEQHELAGPGRGLVFTGEQKRLLGGGPLTKGGGIIGLTATF